jgi:hypothetical protein
MFGKFQGILPNIGKRLAGDGSSHLSDLPMFGKSGPFLPNIGKMQKLRG